MTTDIPQSGMGLPSSRASRGPVHLVRSRPLLAAVLLGLFLSVGMVSARLAAQDRHCDQHLKQTSTDPTGYRPRSDRCEGIYIREVGNTTLLVASLTESVEDFNPAGGKPLLIEWTPPEGAEVHLRANSLRHRLYYRMDTVRPPGSRSYTWPTNLLSTFNLRRNELGLLAWTAHAVGGTTRDVYVPLRVRQGEGSRSSSYRLTVVPGVELSEVFFSIAPVGSDGRAGAFIKKDEPLKYGYYPADRAVSIPLPALAAPGIYYLEITARRQSGGSASAAPIWLYHSGR
jgi:hypothetical protein